MSAYTIADISNALAATIKAHTSSPMYTYVLPTALGNFPAACVEPVAANFELNMGGPNSTDVWEFLIYVVVNGNTFDTAKAQLGKFCSGSGPDSIRQIIFEHRDLGLEDVEAFIHGMSGYGGKFPWFNTNHIGAALLCRVYIN